MPVPEMDETMDETTAAPHADRHAEGAPTDAPEHSLRRAYVYRLMPTRAQGAALERTLETCRLLYNLAIDQRRRAMALYPCSPRRWLTWYDQKRELKDLRPAAQVATTFSDAATTIYGSGAMALMDVPSWTLQDVLQRVDRAFTRWLKPDASGRRAGYPHYRKRGDYHSWTYHSLTGGAALRTSATDDLVGQRQGARLRLYAVPGDVRVIWHRALRGTIKTTTILREPDGWYVAFSCADVPRTLLPATGKTAALDVRVASFATLDDGTALGNPRLYERALRDLRLAQRRLDRRKPAPGQPASAGYEEARVWLAKAHLRVRRARAQFHHTVARHLVNGYDTLYREDLDIKTLLELREEERSGQSVPTVVRRAKNRGMADTGWGNFFGILDAKGEETGRRVVAVNPAYTTRACSTCGAVLDAPLRAPVYACPSCGTRLPKAVNAARNVLRAGQAVDAAKGPSSHEH